MYRVTGVRLANRPDDPNRLVVVLELDDGRWIEVIDQYHGGGVIHHWTNCDVPNESHVEIHHDKG